MNQEVRCTRVIPLIRDEPISAYQPGSPEDFEPVPRVQCAREQGHEGPCGTEEEVREYRRYLERRERLMAFCQALDEGLDVQSAMQKHPPLDEQNLHMYVHVLEEMEARRESE